MLKIITGSRLIGLIGKIGFVNDRFVVAQRVAIPNESSKVSLEWECDGVSGSTECRAGDGTAYLARLLRCGFDVLRVVPV